MRAILSQPLQGSGLAAGRLFLVFRSGLKERAGHQWCAESAIVGSADGLQVKLRNGSADHPRYEASQLSLTTCNIEGLVVVGLGLHSVVLCTISAF